MLNKILDWLAGDPEKVFKSFFVGWLVYMGISMVLLGGLIYVVVHFIAKFW